MVVLAMQYSDTRYGGTHSACAAPINIEAPCSGGWWWWWQLQQPRSSNKLSTLIIIILNPPASSWQWWSLGFKKGVKEVNASLSQLLPQFRRFRQLEIFLHLELLNPPLLSNNISTTYNSKVTSGSCQLMNHDVYYDMTHNPTLQT